MLKPYPFANAVALTVGIIYVVFYILLLAAPSLFAYVYNAQFLGADAVSLFTSQLSFGTFLGVLVTVVITGWITGYIWAALYNHFSK